MAKCEICQKDTHFGRKISITRSQVSRTPKTMHVCTRCLRSGAVERA